MNCWNNKQTRTLEIDAIRLFLRLTRSLLTSYCICILQYSLSFFFFSFNIHVMPQLEAQLTVENDDVCSFLFFLPFLNFSPRPQVRTELVRLLSRMFGKKESDLHTRYRKLFDAFLKRFTDKNGPIREIMLEFLAHYLLSHSDHAAEFSSMSLPSFSVFLY